MCNLITISLLFFMIKITFILIIEINHEKKVDTHVFTQLKSGLNCLGYCISRQFATEVPHTKSVVNTKRGLEEKLFRFFYSKLFYD